MPYTILRLFYVFLLVPIFSYSFDLNNNLELSYINTSGNTNLTTFSSKLKTNLIIYETEELKFKLNILKSRDSKIISANKYDIKFDYNHMFSDNLFSYLGTSYIKDKLSDYRYRFNAGPGVGYKILNNESNMLSIQTGFDYSFDKYFKNNHSEYIASKTELDYSYKVNNDLQINQTFSYLVSLEDKEKYFINSETSLTSRLINNISIGVSYKIDYTNYTLKIRTDKKFLTSIIVDF